jgi:hypothetical protein
VVLAGGEHVETDFFSFLRDRHGGTYALGFGGCVARRRILGDVADREDSELHA